MSDDHAARLAALEQLDEDLFDFPDVEGMSDLLAAARGAAAGGAAGAPSRKPAAGGTRAAAEAPGETRGPLPAPRSSAQRPAGGPDAPPRNVDDLDEDLFGFGELFELGAHGDLGANEVGSSALEPSDAPFAPSKSAAPAATTPPPTAPRKQSVDEPVAASDAPARAAAPVSDKRPDKRPDKAREAGPKKGEAEPRAATRQGSAHDTAASAPATASARNAAPSKRELEPAALGASSPFLPFPASIDLPPARSKLLWVLVGCFLLANGGVFLMTQQQNQNVNETLVAVTSTLAEAVARGSSAAPRETPREAPQYREPEADPASAAPPMLDPANFSNTNELGLHNARRLIEQGAYAEARRNLFFILANQDRSTPLTPTLREDIDYLIALTYYDQGRSIAVEEAR